MASLTPNTIVLKGRGIQKEAPAGAAVTPGEMIEIGTNGKAVVHSTAKGVTSPSFAKEYELIGREITVAYALDENLIYETLPPGAEVYALVAAAAVAIVIGDYLESAGDGTLRKQTPFSQSGSTPFAVTTEGHAIARAIEAVDNSGGGSEARIKVEIV